MCVIGIGYEIGAYRVIRVIRVIRGIYRGSKRT